MNSLKYIFLEDPQLFLLIRTVIFPTLSKLYLAQRRGLCRSSFQTSAVKSKLQASFDGIHQVLLGITNNVEQWYVRHN